MVILARLFSLQIINGAEYRETSNTRISRETTIDATRGNILDRNGTALVSSEMTFSLEMYKSKTDDASLNSSISLMTEILQNNGDSYADNFPISIEPFEYNFESDEKLLEWKKKYSIPETASAEEAFYLFRDKYNIDSEDISEIRRILAIRYEITTKGYSVTKSLSISSSISRNSAIQLQENSSELTGVNVVTDTKRIYNMGNLASHIIGYMGRISESDQKRLASQGDTYEYEATDKIGKSGIERVFEKYLRGTDGTKQIDMDVNGTITGEYVTQEAIGGSDIALTIDANLQEVAEQALADCIQNINAGTYGKVYNATGGAVVAIDVNTGEVLAMASNPDYTPQVLYDGISTEQYADYNNRNVWVNKAIAGTYAPGSTYKMITAIAGLETGEITATEKINDTGVYVMNLPGVDNPACWLYNEYKYGHGKLNVVGALAKSCNYFFYETSVRVGISRIVTYAKHFGLGVKTGIELNGEALGQVADRGTKNTWSAADTTRAAIGQSTNIFTPIQMAKYIAMVANGGKNIDVTIVKSIINSDGTTVSDLEKNEFVNSELGLTDTSSDDDGITINSDTLAVIREGMRSVAEEEGGTAFSVFNDFSIEVGGKTGSAEAGKDENGQDIVNAWFVGFAPYDNPQIAVVVIIENGGHGYYAGNVVKSIMQEYFGTERTDITEDMSVESEMESLN
jgi:penicillin-binding protein 2